MTPCPNFIAGEWRVPAHVPTTPVYNPSRGEVIAVAPLCGADAVNEAVEAASAAFFGWADTPPTERARVFFRFKMLLEDHFEELARSVTREHGKTAAEARGDVRRGIEMVEFACGIPSLLMARFCPTSRAASTATPSASRSGCARASRRLTSLRWCRCGCTRWRWCAGTPSSSSRARRSRSPPSASRSCSNRQACLKECSTSSTADARRSIHF